MTPRSNTHRVVLGIGVLLCFLGAFGIQIPIVEQVHHRVLHANVFQLGAATAFASWLVP